MTFRKLRLLMSKYGFSILFMGFELWASFAAFFWLNRWFPHWLSVAVIGLLYVSTILAIVNRNTPPENKVTWLLIAVIPVFGSLLYLMFGERRLSKQEMIQLENMESMKFREDNSHQSVSYTHLDSVQVNIAGRSRADVREIAVLHAFNLVRLAVLNLSLIHI